MKKNKQEEKDLQNIEPAQEKHSFFSRIIKIYKDRREKKLAKIKAEEKLSDEEEKKVEEKIEEATKEVSKSSEKSKKIRNIVFFIFNILLVAAILIWNVYTTEGLSPLRLDKINFLYVFSALMLLVAIVTVDVISVHRMIYKKTMRSRWHLSYKSLGILRYYDAVTPLSSGGQAFMVTYLTSRDVPASTSLSIPIAKLVFQNIAWLIIAFVCLVIAFTNGMSTDFVSAASIIGFILAAGMIAIIIFISLSKKLGKKLVSGGLKLLTKMKLIKNYDKTYAKVLSIVEDYQNIMKEYSKAKFDVVVQVVLHALRFICLYSIPFFIFCAFKGFNPNRYSEFFLYTALIELASSFIPLPGGTGMNEISFNLLFSTALGGDTFWALILWRFCSYYFYLLQGIGIITYDTIYGNRKYRWVKKRLTLQNESQQFRHTQIENFRQERLKRRKKLKKSGVKV